ncbi:hypothetical protein BCR34DRAFT_497227, partial [Clohesyomyces aquaticus]
IADLMYGEAAYISRSSTVFHLFINAGSTILLSASNYTMQVLCSPSREDIDIAHTKGSWLDVGLLSLRNLRSIPRRRAVMWFILAVSSIPLHLFYNASVFQIATFNEYDITTIDVKSAKWNELNSTSDTYWNLSNTDWKQIYNKKYVSEHGDLYIIIDRLAFATTIQDFAGKATEYMPLTIQHGNWTHIENITIESPEWIRYDVFTAIAENTNVTDPTRPISAHVTHAWARIVRPQSRINSVLTS